MIKKDKFFLITALVILLVLSVFFGFKFFSCAGRASGARLKNAADELSVVNCGVQSIRSDFKEAHLSFVAVLSENNFNSGVKRAQNISNLTKVSTLYESSKKTISCIALTMPQSKYYPIEKELFDLCNAFLNESKTLNKMVEDLTFGKNLTSAERAYLTQLDALTNEFCKSLSDFDFSTNSTSQYIEKFKKIENELKKLSK